jgi:hypothetical protein
VVDIGKEMAIVSVLIFPGDTNESLTSVEVSKTIAEGLREGPEIEFIRIIHDEVGELVVWSDTDVVGAEVACTKIVTY